MPNDNQPKKTKNESEGNQPRSLTQSSSEEPGREASGNQANPSTMRHQRVERQMVSRPLYSDTGTEKLASLSDLNIPLRSFPFQVSTPPFPQLVRRVSREDFRQRLIETIDEALGILDDDSDLEENSENSHRED